MAARDQRLLVRRRHDLSGRQRCEHGPQAHDSAGGDHDHADVGPGREGDQGVGTADLPNAAGEIQRRGISAAPLPARQGDCVGMELRHLAAEQLGLVAGREGHDPEPLGHPRQDVERLAADGARRAEDDDADATRRVGLGFLGMARDRILPTG